MEFTLEQIQNEDKRWRVQLVNTLAGLKSAVLVGTSDSNGNDNLAIFSSFTHFGSSPPLFGLVFRPDSVERHTYTNILQKGFYTINHVTENMLPNAHQTSARYPKQVDEFKACSIEKQYIEHCEVPFVTQSPLKMLLKLEEVLPIRLNGTYLVIGSLQRLFTEIAPDADGFLDLQRYNLVTVTGLDTYFKSQQLLRLPYAKAD